MNEPLISIVIPVYNVEQYLDYCMQSVFAQTYKNLEIILVDDGATDSSGKMCDEYAKKDARVKVIHKENGGLSSARNTGMKEVNGEYFSFIDSDDYIRVDYISKMYEYMLNDNADMVVCSFKKVVKDEEFRTVSACASEHYVFEKEMARYKILSRQVPIYAHGKLYKAELAKEMEFPVGRLHEDIPVTWNVIQYVNKMTYAKDEIYFYRQRVDSIINAKYRHGRMDQLYFSEEILAEFREKNEYYYAAVSRCFFSASDNITIVTKEYAEDWKYLFDAIKKYKAGVLKDSSAESKLKIMACFAYISPYLVRLVGKIYKRINYLKWKNN